MFHQVRLLAEDRPLLRFIWRDLRCEDPPDVYQWEVLPFGMTSSPCCAIFALQQHTHNHQDHHPDTLQLVLQCFYVDNYLESFPTMNAAKEMVDKLRSLLLEGGFDLRQWASNQPDVMAHLPMEARSLTTEQWLGLNQVDPMEPTLGLRWNCAADTLGYHHRPIENTVLTMRRAYQVLASQYDPLGFILPFTTRAKVPIQQLWSKQREWDDPDLPPVLKEAWESWESELQQLSAVSLPQCYSAEAAEEEDLEYDLYVFCDASENAYGAVAYLTVHSGKTIHTSFVMARSRVAPKRQQSIPRLELCAALAGAQLAKLVQTEVTLAIRQTVLWSDSMTVLEWLQSDSCRFKVFVGTRVSEIQELTDRNAWRYVDTHNNPADDITRGKQLLTLAHPSRWSQGPPFLKQSMEHWPKKPESATPESLSEVKDEILQLLESSNPCPLDPIPSPLLRSISLELLPFISSLINSSLSSGYVPQAFKTARVVPILKKPSLDSSDVSSYRPNQLQDINQSGFKPAHSTETALIAVTERLQTARSAKLSSVLILLDLSAAFDTVNHKILLSVLTDLGITGTAWKWFESYLEDRHYQVCNRISACLTDISSWMTAHHLKLNPSKTELLFIPSTTGPHCDLAISFGNSLIAPTEDARSLGEATQLLVQSLVISRLDYCNSLLAGLPLRAIRLLRLVQNAAARIIFNLPKFTHVTPLLRSLHWLPVVARIRFKTLMLAYKAKNGPAPPYLMAMVKSRAVPRALRASNGGMNSHWASEQRTVFKRRLKTHLFIKHLSTSTDPLFGQCLSSCFPDEVAALREKKPVPNHSRLSNLAPEWDPVMDVIRVGGRLRRSQTLTLGEAHPVVLDPRHPATQLLIKEFDERLLHPGAERVYTEIRRQYWILRGRQAIRHHQLHCPTCQRWRAQPKVPQMSDLPPERLRLLCPPFFSTGVDCFGPYLVKIGRRTEKRWGVVFKCLTTRAVHIELLSSMDADTFLLALRKSSTLPLLQLFPNVSNFA
ncbi:hypothetical protein NFI96_009438, partial [Prochilodus magdalenae]